MMALNNIKYFECCRGLRVFMLKVLLRCGKAYQCTAVFSIPDFGFDEGKSRRR